MIGVNVPKLRFPEFCVEWGETKLENISDKISDGIHSTPKYEDGMDYFFVNGNNLVNKNIVVNENTKTVSEEEYRKYKKNLNENTILISINGTIGNLAYYKNEKVILGKSAAYINLKSDEIKEFIYNYIQTHKIKSFFSGELTGTTIKNLSLATLKSTPIFLPNLEEQQKIASFLSNVDEKIEKLEKKQELWETYKKGIMQQLFSQKLRFKDENGVEYPDWEEKKFENIMDQGKAGGTPTSTNKNYYGGSIPFLSISDMTSQGKFIKSTAKHITEEGLNNSSSWIVPKNSLLYSIYASVGSVAINKSDISTSQAIFGIILNENIVKTEYIYYYLLDYKRYIHRFIETGTQGNLNAKTVRNLVIKLPSMQEQSKISNYLSSIDIKIEQINKALIINNKFKKGLLQQMFC